jgi:hypothetical protein
LITLGVVAKFPRNMHTLFPSTFTLITMVKVLYYIWAFAGGYMYFTEVSGNEDLELKRLSTALLVLTIINIVDVLRFAMIIALFAGIHFICKRRARNQRLNSDGTYENLESEFSPYSPTLFRDTENYYRFREITKSENRIIKKKCKTVHFEKPTMCAICCDDMKVGTVLSCNGQHVYH